MIGYVDARTDWERYVESQTPFTTTVTPRIGESVVYVTLTRTVSPPEVLMPHGGTGKFPSGGTASDATDLQI
jgi:hypothetical protein